MADETITGANGKIIKRRSPAGSGYISPSGYRYVYRDGKRVLEHRSVMETALGRALLPDETVHHRNGQKADNRPENLELRVSHPQGQSVAEALAWAHEIIERYEGVAV